MFGWNTRSLACGGSVLFRGTLPPRLENFAQLAKAGVTVRKTAPQAEVHWSAQLEHPKWGPVRVFCPRQFTAVPLILVDHDPRLTPEDRAAIKAAGSWITLEMDGSRKNILRDRKTFLRFLRLFLADDGIIAMDHLAQRFWTREALDDELQHDADVDVESLFVSHAIADGDAPNPSGDDEETRCGWLHSHGLAELGTLDFDILRPSPVLTGRGYDTVRALAYTLLDKGPAAAGQTIPLFAPGGDVTLVAVEEFNRVAPAADRALREDLSDPVHNRQRVVLCDPARRRLFGLLGGGGVRASRACANLDGDHLMALFPDSATALMAQRARQTFRVFAALAEEFREFEAKPIAKFGYPVDGTAPEDNNCEHMWFEIHGFAGDSVDATLCNQPFNIAAMKAGDRGRHSVGRLTDWMLLTPAGDINPRSMRAARILRDHAPEIRAEMARRSGSANT